LAVVQRWSTLRSWLVVAAIAVVVAAVAQAVVTARSIDVRLDGSRRWVHLGNVHPHFAAAVQASINNEGRIVV
jgi:hypothetical protein